MGQYFVYNGELYHHGVKGMKWGVRRAEKRAKKTRAYIDREIEFQRKRIEGYRSEAKSYRDSAKQIRKNGDADLRKKFPNLSDKERKAAVDGAVKKMKNEARWNEHIAKHLEVYNKKLSELDVAKLKMGRLTAAMYIQTLGETTRNEINSTWRE